ncbi:hypothetical protein JCM11251_002864 [Rhodosporidiobolus azoricus]
MKPSKSALRSTHTRSAAVQVQQSPPWLSFKSRPKVGEGEMSARLWQGGGRRSLFGLGEVLGVLANPSEMLRNLAESKKLLEEAREELQSAKEKSQIPASHTFSPLPGFFDRPAEIQAIQRALGSVPGFTVLFGASSVGKTALLRQVLSSDKYHVLHFDLRIAGFADLASLYMSLSTQAESYFAAIPDLLGREFGWGEFEKSSWAFKHARLELQKRLENGGEVKTSDVAALMELMQSALLSYWNFQPMTEAQRQRAEQKKKEAEEAEKDSPASASSPSSPQPSSDKPSPASKSGRDRNPDPVLYASHRANDPTEARMRQGAVADPSLDSDPTKALSQKEKEVEEKKKKADLLEARGLGIKEREEQEGMEQEGKSKVQKAREEEEEDEPKPPPKRIPVIFLDEGHRLPALIKSEDTMKTLLDALITLSKQDRLLHVLFATSDPFLMTWLRQMNIMQHANILSVGDTAKNEARRYYKDVLEPHIPDKLKHKIDYEKVYEVFGGKLAHLSDYTSEFVNSDGDILPRDSSHFLQAHSLLNLQLIHSMPPPSGESEDSQARGFRIYSSLAAASPASAPSPFDAPSDAGPDFSPSDLLRVMRRLAPQSGMYELPYFPLCRELGARAVDGMIRGRVLELRWSRTITEEGDLEDKRRVRDKLRREGHGDEAEKIIGPVVVPTTPVVRFAMGEVLREYEREGWSDGEMKRDEKDKARGSKEDQGEKDE